MPILVDTRWGTVEISRESILDLAGFVLRKLTAQTACLLCHMRFNGLGELVLVRNLSVFSTTCNAIDYRRYIPM